jgi:predicted dehydrogenase
MHKVLSNEVEDYFKLMLRFESGFSAQVEVGTFCLVSGPRWIAHGDKGSMIIEDFACNGEIVLDGGYAINWDPTIKNNTAAGPTRTMAPRPPETLKIEELPNVDDKTDWCQFYKNLMSAIDGEAELLVKPEAALRVMKIIESAFKSNELGEAVKVNV